jgi:bifunctional N-acetylglucosamine-1-phosphate-uridyltransferase/glucosamine-1-phosphate-acetyltransferase GlmU-like protein
MKIIIPAAGAGTRLRPHTHTTPRALVQVAGKPILGHILDRPFCFYSKWLLEMFHTLEHMPNPLGARREVL